MILDKPRDFPRRSKLNTCMASVLENLIAVHGRAGLLIPYSRFIDNAGVDLQVDISTHDIYLEVPAAKLRVKLVADPEDIKGQRILLTRADVEKLPETPASFIVLDETGIIPVVDWEGKICRTGYKGDPSG